MKKAKKPISLGKKILYVLIALALVIALIYLAYYLIRFTFYDTYKQHVGSYEYEQGSELVLGSKSLADYPDYKLVTESDSLELYLNETTSNVAILDKRNGEVTFAAPPAGEDDPIANATNKNYLQSHIIVDYYNSSRAAGIFDSYTMAVEKQQVTFEAIEGGVRVIYDMGDYSDSIGLVTWYMMPEKFEEICSKLDEKDAANLARYYTTETDIPGTLMLVKTGRTNRMTREKIEAILDSAGFTLDDCVEQMTLAGAEVTVPVSFIVPLEYRLKDDYVEVNVPVNGIEEYGGACIYRIQVLRNFGAANTEEDGYIVVPNGDGSIINFNNGKNNVGNYSQFIYGIDPLAADYTVVEEATNATMALFGLVKENATILATIEDGAALASVTAGVSGRVNSYNYAYTTFVVRGSETLAMFGTTGNEAELPVLEESMYDSNLTVRYTFLDDEHQGYTGMANYYRDRLIAEGILTKQQTSGDIKFYYDVIAGVEMTEFFLGKQYMATTAMTTFDEAGQISNMLAEAGISNQVMNLQGWFNGGYYHDVADYIFVPWKLGGKSGLEELNSILDANGGTMYADVLFQKVPYNSKRYNYQAETSKYYGSGYVAGFGQVNPVTLRQTSALGYVETMYDLVSPKFLVRYTGKFAEKIQDYDISGISLRDLGSEIHSDKRRTEVISREAALDIVESQLALMESTGKNVLVNQANDYAWSVADDILNLPLSDNEYPIVDEDIPLYEMIVHGCIDYSGELYNLANVEQNWEQVLNLIEYGAAPHFVFTWEETSEMKYSGLNGLYSTTFSVWKDTAVSVYEEVNGVLSQVNGASMVSHEILDNGVRIVTYSNGVTIYINYASTDCNANGVTVPAMGYVVK